MDKLEGNGAEDAIQSDEIKLVTEPQQKSADDRTDKAEDAPQTDENKVQSPQRQKSADGRSKGKRNKEKPSAERPAKEPTVSKNKALPDISKLSSARPTKVPRTTKDKEQIIQETRPPLPNFKWLGIGAAAIIVIVGAVYGNSIYGQAVFNDEFNFHYVSAAMQDQTYWLQHWVDAIKQPFSQPWVSATYGWDLTSFNWNAGWSHLVNVVLHLTACLYLYMLVFTISRRLQLDERLKASPYIIAIAAAALFAFHPLTTGSVAYISGRSGPLLAANYFLALNLFLVGYAAESINFALAAYMAFFIFNVIALFCNAQAITLPLSAVVIGLLLKDPKQSWVAWRDSRGYELIFFFVAALGEPFLLRFGVPRITDNGLGLHTLSSLSYMASQCKLLVTYYLRCFLVPFGLTPDPPYTVAASFADPMAMAGAAVVIAALAAIWIWRKKVLLVVGLELFLVGLLPTSLIVQPELVADQRFYLSLAGLCIASGWGLAEFYALNKRGAAAVALVILFGFGGLTIWRNHQWSTDQLLWKQAIKLNPESARAHALYAKSLSKPDQTFAEAQKALALDPQNVIALETTASYQLSKDNFAAAETALEKAITIWQTEGASDQDVASLQGDLAHCYAKEQKMDKAQALAQKVLKSLPEDPNMNLIVAQSLLAKKEYILAFTTLYRSLRQDPRNPDILRCLAESGLSSGVPQMMQNGYMAAMQYDKVNPGREGRLFLAKCMLRMNEPKEALITMEPVVKLSKNTDAEALYIKSLALEGLKMMDQAKEAKELALKLDGKIAQKIVIQSYISPAADKKNLPATKPVSTPSPSSTRNGASPSSTGNGASSSPGSTAVPEQRAAGGTPH